MKTRLDYDEIENILFCIEREIQGNDYINLFKDIRRAVSDFDEKVIWYRS